MSKGPEASDYLPTDCAKVVIERQVEIDADAKSFEVQVNRYRRVSYGEQKKHY